MRRLVLLIAAILSLGRRLYVVNARFGTPPTPETPYWVTEIRKP